MGRPPYNAGKRYRRRGTCRAGHPRIEGDSRCRACNAEAQARWREKRGRDRYAGRNPGVVQGYDEPC